MTFDITICLFFWHLIIVNTIQLDFTDSITEQVTKQLTFVHRENGYTNEKIVHTYG